MRNWLWPPSSATQYQWRHRVGDQLFLSLAKREIERESGKRPRYLALRPRFHEGLMRSRDGYSYRWFRVPKNGYSSATRMLISLHGVEARYRKILELLAEENQACHRVTTRKIRIFGRTETVQYPRPAAGWFLRLEPFSAEPRADIRFCILRHPLDRFVSVYRRHMIRSRFKNLRRPYTKLLSPDAFCAELEKHWHERPWKEGLTAMRAVDGYAQDQHLWPQHFYLGRDASYFTHIFSFSELPRVAEFLSDLHRKHVKLPQVNSSGAIPMPHLSASLRRRVELLYEEDFEIFGRNMPPPRV